MGINGLLPLLKSIQKPCHVKNFSGQTIGIDAYGWLHRGTIACAVDLATGKPTRRHIDFAMHRVRMLLHFGVKPYLVFDGDYLPSKAATEDDRARRREQSKKAGLELLRAGKGSQAYAELQKAIDVTPEMARQLIDELKKANVQYVVAPYEADAQMVYLERQGIITGILSEDSDLLVFGAQCLLTKLDQYGNCIEINRKDFGACREVTLTGWSDKEFRQMAILSGCDYLANINNMGLKTAHRMMRKHKTVENVVRMLQYDGRYRVPKNYLEEFYRAERTFLYQRVYCPVLEGMRFHTEPHDTLNEAEMPYIGAFFSPEISKGVAKGELHPTSKEPLVAHLPPPRSGTWGTPMLQRSVSAPEPKKPKPLDTFFKPRRTPLAELDPNSFVLTEGQQQLLQQNPGSWEARPAPPVFAARASVAEPQTTGTLRQRSPRVRGPSLRRVSDARPSKRLRLCSDDVPDAAAEAKASTTSSPFFRALTAQSATNLIRPKCPRKADFAIFSDSSKDKATTNTSIPSAKEACNASDAIVSKAPMEQQKLPSIPITPKPASSRLSMLPPKRPASITLAEKTPSTPQVAASPATFDLKAKFGFSASPHLQPHQGFLPTPPSSARSSRIPLAVSSRTVAPSSNHSPFTPVQTPLQRMKSEVLNRQRAPPVHMTPCWLRPARSTSVLATPASTTSAKDRPIPFPEMQNLRPAGASKAARSAVDIPLPPPDETENQLLSLSQGSEDYIVEGSDDEAEDYNSSSKPSATKALDLRKFAYATRE